MYIKTVITAALLFVLSACASNTELSDPQKDPYEPFNRAMFSFNEVVDSILLKPVAQGYRFVVPEDGRKLVSNAFRNFYEPVTMANALLQGDDQRFFTAFWRFILNTTLGFGGLYDFAGENTELKYRNEDFGQTLGVWAGNQDSSYLVLPIFGPSTVRDAFGRVVDVGLNPWTYALEPWESVAIGAGDGVQKREQLLDVIDDIYEDSFDPYATIRSGYLQRRDSEILNNQVKAATQPLY